MTYNPSSIFSRESYAQYGRSRGASKPTVSKPKTTGLGSRQYSRKTPSKPTQTKSTWESLKERISNIIGDSGGDNKPKSAPVVKPIKVYERKEFNIKPVDVSVSTLPDAPTTQSTGFEAPVMRPQSPTNRMDKPLGLFDRPTPPSRPNINMSKPMGLMSPPNMGSVPSTSTGTIYKIKRGDTLSEIAQKYNTSVEILARDNNIKDINKIQAGKTLKVPLYGMDDDPDKEFYQSGVPMDQREFAPEGPEYVPLPDYQGTPDTVVMGAAGQHSGKFSSKDDFLKSMIPVAKVVAARTGLDYRLIVAQAAIETGWGSKVKGNAFFGIKGHGADNTIDFKTTEEVDGKKVSQTDTFRAYENIGDAATDYGRFLQNNPRYSEYLAATNLEDAAAALQASGYATDSKYGEKVLTTARGRTLRNFLERNPEYK